MIKRISFLLFSLLLPATVAAENICGSKAQSEAIKFLQNKYDSDSEDKIARGLLAGKLMERYRKEHNPDDVVKADNILKVDGQEKRTIAELVQYALVLKAEHRFSEGIDLLKPEIEKNKNTKNNPESEIFKSAKLLLIDFYTELGQTKEALSLISEFKLPEDDLTLRLARLAELRGDDEGAISYFRTYVKRVSDALRYGYDTVWAKLSLSDALVRIGKIEEASSILNEASSICPDYWAINERKAELTAMQGEYKEALVVYETLAKEHPTGPLFESTAALLKMMGELEQAKVYSEKAEVFYRQWRDKNGIMFLHHEVSLLADLLNKPCDAMELAERDLKMRVTWQTLEAFAWSAYGCGQKPIAKEKIEAALTLNSSTPHLLYRAGIILNGIGEWRRGKNLIQEARRKNPWVAAFHAHR
jgi:tetratricopeptide (TPR) repeat protein